MLCRTAVLLIIVALLATRAAVGAEGAEKVYRLGYLSFWYSTSDSVQRLALSEGLRTRGYLEGERLVVERRYAEGKIERLPDLAAELVRLRVDVIVAVSTPAGLVAKRATSTIPIVVAGSSDMVESGLVADPQRPGGNVTGVQFLRPQLVVRQMEILKQVVPTASRLGFLGNPNVPSDAALFRALERRAAASAVSIGLVTRTDLDRLTFARLADTRIQGLIVGPSMTEIDPSRSLVRMAAENKLPTMYPGRQFVEAGGLISYFADPADQGRHVAVYVDKILRGAAPADLPVEQYASYELAINLRTAKALNLTVPSALVEQAAAVFR
jgi:putative ABC transport system substrate-binding protein